MKNPVLSRAFAAVVSLLITLVLFDQVARMGQPVEAMVTASVPVRVAVVDR